MKWRCNYCDKELNNNKKADKYELTCKENPCRLKKNSDFKTFLITSLLFLIFIVCIYSFYIYPNFIDNKSKSSNWSLNIPTTIITPTLPQKKTIEVKKITNSSGDNNDPWGVAKQIDEVTWTMKIGEDSNMATPNETLSALNEYRKKYNAQVLTVDEKLKNYAQSRADYIHSIKRTDKHQGFNNFLENEDGFNKLGFTWLGENASFGFQLNGVHLIEWMYAGDEPHNKNQLDNKWSHVGIGVKGTATCLIFGTGKM